MTTYAKRKIDVTINLGKGQFGDDKGEDVTLTGHKVSAQISYSGGHAQGEMHIKIYGLTLDMINQLTGTGPRAGETRRNTVMVAAGDEGGAMSTIFIGYIYKAFGNFSNIPDATLEIVALSAYHHAVRAVNANSYAGPIDAAVVMAEFARVMGLGFEGNDVSVMLQNPYYHGTMLRQVKDCAKEAGIEFSIELGKLAIWGRGKPRDLGDPVLISPETGMVGYPDYGSAGLTVTTLFNPAIVLARKVEIKSNLAAACGLWNAYVVTHSLESETPNGQWFTQASCVAFD